LGPQGINIQEFCKQFNDATKDMKGDIVPAEISIFEDRSFSFILKTSPVSDLLRKAAGIEKGSKDSLKNKVGKITKTQLREIAEKKMPDLNANTIEAAEKIIAGTAKNMGIEII
jgi:large subunit ribosomal protein L11